MIEIVILAVLTMAGGAVALRAGRVLLERVADRARDTRAAADAAADAAAAGEAATAARHRAHPDWLVTLQAALLRSRIHPLEQRRDQLDAERRAVDEALAAQPYGPSLVRKLLGYACLLLIPMLFLLSVYQLVPSFYTLSGNAPLSLLGGVVVAAVEVGVAFAVARVLYHSRGDETTGNEDVTGSAPSAAAAPGASDTPLPGEGAGQRGRRPDRSLAARALAAIDSRPGWSKTVLGAAITLAVAAVLVWGQYQWAPAHDTIPLSAQLTAARETYAQDQSNGTPESLLTSDEQAIDSLGTRLAEVRARDEALAVVVSLGEDAVALPALGAFGFAAGDLRRLSRRRRKRHLDRRIGALDVQIEQATDAMTLELQRMLDGLGIDPAVATATRQPAQVPQPPVPPAVTAGPAQPAAPGQIIDPGQPGTPGFGQLDGPAITADELFPAAAARPGRQPEPGTDAADAPGADDRRWLDPL